MLAQKIFENVHDLMAILVLFEQFSAKFCFNFLTLILSASPNIMHFVRAFSIYACIFIIEEAQNYEKIVYIKNISKTAGGRMHTPHPTPLGPPLAISYKNHQRSLAYFGHMAPFILSIFYLLKDKVKLRGPGGGGGGG